MNVVIAALLVSLASAQGGDLPPQPLLEEPQTGLVGTELGAEPEQPRGLVRTSLVPWSVRVLGKNYESFPNDEASIVLTDWLEDALISLKVFTVVNRDRIQAVLSEQRLAASADGLASAGRLESVDYILEGNFKNLGRTSEVAFKVLDVKTATYTHRLRYPIPFNPEIESTRAEIERLVSELAARFPVEAPITKILDVRRVLIPAGSADGILAKMSVELWRVGGSSAEVAGEILRAGASEAEVELESPVAGLNVFDFVVRVKVVQPAQALMKKGLALFEAGDYRAAADKFREGLDIKPADGLLRANYARAVWKMGDRGLAVDAFRQALQLRPDDVPLLEDAATAMLGFGRNEELIETLEQGERWRLSVPLTLAFGLASEVLGDFRGAEEAYASALKRDPNSAESHLRLAILGAKRDELDETRTELRMAGLAGRATLELELATAAFRIVTTGGSAVERGAVATLAGQAQSVGDVASLCTASEVLLLQPSEWALSLSLALSAADLNGDYLRATLAAARAHAAGGQRDPAIALLGSALAVQPSNVALLLLSGDLLVKEQRFGEAQSRYERALDLARDDWRPADALGDLHTALQDQLKAVGAYRKALEALDRAGQQSGSELAERLHKLGKAAVLANQLDTARPYLERCVAEAPEDTVCQHNLGVCYFNDPNSASRAMGAFQAAPDIIESWYYLGELHLRQAARGEAMRSYRRCAQAADCMLARQSQRQLQRLESMTGTVTKVRANDKKVTLDLGRIHGMRHNMEGVVDLGKGKRGRIRIEEVRPDSSVALVLKGGSPRVGQTVRFGASSPRGVTVAKHPRRGYLLRWRRSPEPEVVFYEVQKRGASGGSWRSEGRVRHPKSEYHIKNLKPGETAFFRVLAINQKGVKSAPSQVVEVGG